MSTELSNVPRIQSVVVFEPMQLNIVFENGIEKNYDLRQLAGHERFTPLFRDPSFVKSVKIDPGGYGISWDDNIDLSENELWTHGVEHAS